MHIAQMNISKSSYLYGVYGEVLKYTFKIGCNYC